MQFVSPHDGHKSLAGYGTVDPQAPQYDSLVLPPSMPVCPHSSQQRFSGVLLSISVSDQPAADPIGAGDLAQTAAQGS